LHSASTIHKEKAMSKVGRYEQDNSIPHASSHKHKPHSRSSKVLNYAMLYWHYYTYYATCKGISLDYVKRDFIILLYSKIADAMYSAYILYYSFKGNLSCERKEGTRRVDSISRHQDNVK
jgi:hypothetical protein